MVHLQPQRGVRRHRGADREEGAAAAPLAQLQRGLAGQAVPPVLRRHRKYAPLPPHPYSIRFQTRARSHYALRVPQRTRCTRRSRARRRSRSSSRPRGSCAARSRASAGSCRTSTPSRSCPSASRAPRARSSAGTRRPRPSSWPSSSAPRASSASCPCVRFPRSAVFGPSNTVSLTSARALQARSEHDLYKQILNIRAEKASIRFAENDRYKSPMVATGASLHDEIAKTQ